MHKGKYEELPNEKKKQKENPLLQTYLTSLLSLVLCVTMFLGTSYAWFTSEVNNTGNEIYIGILDVELEKQVGEEWKSLSELTDGTNTTKLFDSNIRWEPGYTTLETVRVVNKGDLAFNYNLTFTDGKIADSTDTELLTKVAENFVVYVHEGEYGEEETAPASFADIEKEGSGWEMVGTLAEVLNGKAVFSGSMNAGEVNAVDEEGNKVNTTHTYTIALHMKEAADSSVMGHKISLNVKLTAYQMGSEQDGFGNSNYDDITVVSSVAELTEAINTAEDGAVIGIAAGTYDLTDDPLVLDKAITLQGLDPENKPVLQFVTGNGQEKPSIAHGIEIKSSNATLKDLKLEVDPNKTSSGNTVQISANGTEYYSDITIDGCEFYGSDHCIALYGNNVTIQNCVLDESTADDQGNIIYVWGTSGKLTIQNNKFIGKAQKKHGISFYYQSAASQIAGEILIEGNTFENVYKGIVHEGNMTYTDVSVEILNNTFKNCLKKPVAIDNGTYVSYKVNGNVFNAVSDSGGCLLDNEANAAVDANGNYWASESPDWSKVISGDNVTVTTYYTDAEKTKLVNKNANG